MDDPELRRLVVEAGIEEQRRLQILAIFEEEALSFKLLKDMGVLLQSNLKELNISSEEAARLAKVVLRPRYPQASVAPSHVVQPAAASTATSTSPSIGTAGVSSSPTDYEDEHKALKAKLKAYEADFQAANAGRKPKAKEEWGVMWETFQRYAAVRSSTHESRLQPQPEEEEPPEYSPPDGPIIGELPLRWQGKEYDFEYAASSTVRDLKAWLRVQTDVPIDRQRLMGWSPTQKRAAELDETRLAELELGARTKRIMMMGTPQREAALAEAALERNKRTQRLIQDDLEVCLPATTAPARRFRFQPDRRPIMANSGGGIYLDPHVWALSPEEEAAERRRRTGHNRAEHVLNPTTRRLERLGLENALLGGEGAPRVGEDDRLEEGPPNVDMLGVVRGRCTACDRCASGYTRPERPARHHNDTDILNCSRCGCPCHRHERL